MRARWLPGLAWVAERDGEVVAWTVMTHTSTRELPGSWEDPAVSTNAGWVTERLQVDGTYVHCRRSTHGDGIPVVHIHGFAISGAYLMPTARALAEGRVNVVPDLPGYGHSQRRDHVLDIPDLAGALLGVFDTLDIDTAILVGNSMGCPIGLEVAHEAPERVHRLVLVSPAGGRHNQPLLRALCQLATDVCRESPRMLPVALPDYLKFGPLNGLRLFHELTLFPSLERLLSTPVPTLAVLGGRDPLMPSPARVRQVGEIAPDHVTVALVEQAAHAVNFSHPDCLARLIEAWMDGALAEGAGLPPGVRLVDPGRHAG